MSQAEPSSDDLGLIAKNGVMFDARTAIADPKHHYPFDCELTHCVSRTEQCQSPACAEKLVRRLEELEKQHNEVCATQDVVFEQYNQLKRQVEWRWRGVFKFDILPTNVGLTSIGIATVGLCEHSHDGHCKSCFAELVRRTNASNRMETSIYREYVSTLQEYKKDREEDEERARDVDLWAPPPCTRSPWLVQTEGELNETRGQLNWSRRELNEAKRDLYQVQRQLNGLCCSIAEDEAVDWAWLKVDAIELRAETSASTDPDGCKCLRCRVPLELASYQEAQQYAEQRLLLFSSKLGTERGPMPEEEFELKRRERAALYPQFARTGSYRGYGAGDWKPRSYGT